MRAIERDDAAMHDVDIAGIGERASRLGIEIADIVGIIEDLGGLSQKQLDALRSVVKSAKATSEANTKYARTQLRPGRFLPPARTRSQQLSRTPWATCGHSARG